MQFRVSCFWGDFGVIFGWGGPIFGSPRAIFGVPRGVRFWGAQDLRFWGTKGGFVVSNPAFFRGPEMWLWVSCFWGDFRVGGSQFWVTQGHFWGSQRNLVLGSPGFEVLGAPGGFVVSNPAFFRGPETWVWVSCFWGGFGDGFGVGGSHFWVTQGHFWGPQMCPISGSPRI